jgi:hypothetical protein
VYLVPIVWHRGAVWVGDEGDTIDKALRNLRRQLAVRGGDGLTAAGRLKGWARGGRREEEEGVALEHAPIPSGYAAVTGVEIEYYPARRGLEDVTRLMLRAGLAGAVSVTGDGSLGRGGVELRVMATRENLGRVVWKALALAPGRVDSSCGLHVHLDMRHRDVDLVWANLLAMEGVICQSQPKERIMPGGGGGYCKLLRSTERKLTIPNSRDRYRAINAASLGKGTLEVRAHTGSSNPAKILAWCEFLNAIADLGEEILPGASAGETLTRFEGVARREFPYVRERMARFARGWVGGGVVSEPEDSEDSEEDYEDPELAAPEGDDSELLDAPFEGCECQECVRARRMGRADV